MAQTMLAPEHKDRNPTFLKFIYKTENDSYSDVDVTSEYEDENENKETFALHSYVLVKESPLLEDLMCAAMNSMTLYNQKRMTVTIPGTSPRMLQALVQYIYEQPIELETKADMEGFVKLSRDLGILSLAQIDVKACEKMVERSQPDYISENDLEMGIVDPEEPSLKKLEKLAANIQDKIQGLKSDISDSSSSEDENKEEKSEDKKIIAQKLVNKIVRRKKRSQRFRAENSDYDLDESSSSSEEEEESESENEEEDDTEEWLKSEQEFNLTLKPLDEEMEYFRNVIKSYTRTMFVGYRCEKCEFTATSGYLGDIAMHLVRSHFDTFLHRKLMLVFRQAIQVKGAGMEYTCVMCEDNKKSFFSTTHFFKAHRHLVFDHFAKAIDTKDIVPNKEDPVVFHTLITPSSPSSRSESGGEDSSSPDSGINESKWKTSSDSDEGKNEEVKKVEKNKTSFDANFQAEISKLEDNFEPAEVADSFTILKSIKNEPQENSFSILKSIKSEPRVDRSQFNDNKMITDLENNNNYENVPQVEKKPSLDGLKLKLPLKRKIMRLEDPTPATFLPNLSDSEDENGNITRAPVVPLPRKGNGRGRQKQVGKKGPPKPQSVKSYNEHVVMKWAEELPDPGFFKALSAGIEWCRDLADLKADEWKMEYNEGRCKCKKCPKGTHDRRISDMKLHVFNHMDMFAGKELRKAKMISYKCLAQVMEPGAVKMSYRCVVCYMQSQTLKAGQTHVIKYHYITRTAIKYVEKLVGCRTADMDEDDLGGEFSDDESFPKRAKIAPSF